MNRENKMITFIRRCTMRSVLLDMLFVFSKNEQCWIIGFPRMFDKHWSCLVWHQGGDILADAGCTAGSRRHCRHRCDPEPSDGRSSV